MIWSVQSTEILNIFVPGPIDKQWNEKIKNPLVIVNIRGIFPSLYVLFMLFNLFFFEKF